MALCLGHAMDKLVIDVTGNHRLRDSPSEVYIFSSILPTGVFTHTTPCYSYKCSGDGNCYAFGCPTKKQTVVAPTTKDTLRVETGSPRRETTWMQSVPFSVYEILSSNEIKRQETIFEYIQVVFPVAFSCNT